ncbi:MAG: hypothetical protein GXP63_06030 [DPANN group archaeon]|nr:hypothetical protein [DPANN group archaeon]
MKRRPNPPNLLGLDTEVIAGIKDYYETTMADTNLVAGIGGRRSQFNAAVRSMPMSKVVGLQSTKSDGFSITIDGQRLMFEHPALELEGRTFDIYEVEPANYLINTGLEQILGFIKNWEMDDEMIQAYSERGINLKTIHYLEKNRNLNLSARAIPEGIPIFPHEPYIMVDGTFEQVQFPETLILGTWGLQTAIATEASYYINILEEFGKKGVITLEGGSRRIYPGAALAASRAALVGGFNGTSLEAIMTAYPELKYMVGGSTGHSAILHIGSDEEAFELALRAYYHIDEGDSNAVIREKIKNTPGIGPTFLIDTFDSDQGIIAATKIMNKYGIVSQVRNDSGDHLERSRAIRMVADGKDLGKMRIMDSGDLRSWKVYDLFKNKAPIDTLLIGTYLVNPYKLPGAAYKLAQDQPDKARPEMEARAKISTNSPGKSTLPGPIAVYRIIGKDGKADRDIILNPVIDDIESYRNIGEDYIQLDQQVMKDGELVYDLPDMCEIIENAKYHLSLLKPEHKRFKGAVPYPVTISDTVQKAKETYAKRIMQKG